MPLHPRQHRGGRPAVDLESLALLILAKRGAGLHAGFAVDLVMVIAAGGEDLLHPVEIAGGKLRDLAPWRLEWPRIENAVAEMTDEQPMTEPTERSMPPSKMTIVMPVATRPVIDTCLSTSVRFW